MNKYDEDKTVKASNKKGSSFLVLNQDEREIDYSETEDGQYLDEEENFRESLKNSANVNLKKLSMTPMMVLTMKMMTKRVSLNCNIMLYALFKTRQQ